MYQLSSELTIINNLRYLVYNSKPRCEWLWEDLGTYLCKLNPTMRDFSIIALVAADPVSTSRFIDNKFKAMLDFLLSDKGPLGNVIHYCARREYQDRGLQHFHLQLWIKMLHL